MRKHVADSASGATRTVHYLLDTSSAYAQVAARATTVQEMGGATRTERSVFHWGAGSGAAGIGLIRQEHWADGDTGSGTPPALLLPLPGHLGTSLGAVDATGQVVETISHDAFGQRTDAGAAAQSQRFAGEYWDEDAQLVYLRARWYDPKLGRFISGDPFEGRQGDLRSLNRYGYAQGDPVHGADPSGEFSIGESMSTLSSFVTLADVATSAFDHFLGGPSGKETDSQTIWDAFMSVVLGSLSEWLQDSSLAGSLGLASIGSTYFGVELHHTVPVYLCGRDGQPKVSIPKGDHIAIHSALDKVPFAFTLASISVNVVLSRWKAKKNLPALQAYLVKPNGRRHMVRLLAGFYASNGSLSLANGQFAAYFAAESRLFSGPSIRFTSLMSCRK